jgi:hypothetical protein
LLSNNIEFGTLIATGYLILNYELNKNNYFKAVSKYNGGLNNVTYVNKIRNKLSSLKEDDRTKNTLIKGYIMRKMRDTINDDLQSVELKATRKTKVSAIDRRNAIANTDPQEIGDFIFGKRDTNPIEEQLKIIQKNKRNS